MMKSTIWRICVSNTSHKFLEKQEKLETLIQM